LRFLLSRLENELTGAILPPDFHGQIPDARIREAKRVAASLGDAVYCKFPFLPGVKPIASDPSELILNRTWRAALSVVGADGLPAIADAGNVCRPMTAVKLSLRLPPNVGADRACSALRSLLTKDPPYGARVTLDHLEGDEGWDAPPTAAWLETA